MVSLAALLLPAAFLHVAETLSFWLARRRLRSPVFEILTLRRCLPFASDRVVWPIRRLPLRTEASSLQALSTVATIVTPLRLTVRSFCFFVPPSPSFGFGFG